MIYLLVFRKLSHFRIFYISVKFISKRDLDLEEMSDFDNEDYHFINNELLYDQN